MELVWLGEDRPWLQRAVADLSRGHTLSLFFVEGLDVALEKAPDNGVYILNGGRFRVKKGDPMPEGATFEKVEGESKEKRDAQASLTAKRRETTASAGPSETESQPVMAKEEKKS